MLLTAVDDRFLDEASFLIRSCARHAPQQRFYLLLVNSNEQRVKQLRTCHAGLIVEHAQWEYDPQRWRGLMCSARSIPLVHVLETYGEPTLYLDSDTILRRPLDYLWKLLEEYDLLVDYRPQVKVRGAGGTLHGGTFNSGVIATRPNENTLAFFREYDRTIRAWIATGKPLCHFDEAAGVSTCIDQEFLYTVYEQFRDRLRFQPLPKKFNDPRLRADSVIWHGKGTARERPRYVLCKLSFGPSLRYYAFRLLGYPLLSGLNLWRGLLARRRMA